MTKLTENERKALNNACARLRETNLGTKIGNIEDFLDIDILKTDANTVSKAIDELFDKWANPLLNITVPPPGFFTLAGDAEGNLWCYCNDETHPPVFEHDETTGDLYLNIASEDGANSYQVHVGNYIAVKHLNDYYKKTEIDSKLGGKSNTGHEHTSDEIHYAYDQNVSVTTILENKAAKNHTHNYIPSTVSQTVFGSGDSKVTATRQGNVVTLRLYLAGEFTESWKQWCTITDSQYLPDTDGGFTDFGISSSYGTHMLLRINSDGRVRTGYGQNKTSYCYQTITFLKNN